MALLQSNYVSALKEITLPYIQDNFPKKTILLDQVKRNAGVQVINDEFIAPIATSRHGGVGNLASDDNNITSSSGISTSRGTVTVKRIYGAFDISDLAIKSSATNQLAVEPALAKNTKTLTRDFARSINRQLYGDGVGVLAKVRNTGGSVSGTEIAVETPAMDATLGSLDDSRSIDWYGTINSDISPTKYFAKDQIIGIGTGGAADGTVANVTGTSVQLTGATASAANDAVYIQDGSGAGAGTNEMTGIRSALSSSTGTSTYAGVARNTVSWTPQFGSASEALTLKRLTDNYISGQEYADESDKYIILVNKSLYSKYGEILTAMRRTVNETNLIGGWKGLEFVAGGGVVGVFLDYDVPDGEAVIINLDTWTLCQVGELDWLSGGDGSPQLRLQNTTKFQSVVIWYAEAFCLNPAANGRETRKSD